MDNLKNYALVNTATSTVEKIVYWDGVSQITIYDTPPAYELVLIEDKPSFVWDCNFNTKEQFLTEKLGLGSQGMLWDGVKFSMKPDTKPVLADVQTSGVVEF